MNLKERLSLSIPEAMTLTGYGRRRIAKKIEAGDYRTFPEGSRTRIITESIIQDQERRAHGK